MARQAQVSEATGAGMGTDTAAHAVLPRWVTHLQDNWLLGSLIAAQAYVLGTLMTLGWVQDIEQPKGWGIYHGLGVVLFFAAGACAAGVALRCSIMAVQARSWGLRLFNFVGVVAFSGAEIWANLSERSQHLAPTPADTAVLELVNWRGIPISPTVLIVALLLPFAGLYWGFSQSPKPAVESSEERTAREERELARAKHRARLNAVKAAGGRQVLGAAFGRVDPLASDDDTGSNDDAHSGGYDDDNTPGYGRAPRRAGRGAGAPTRLRSGQWNAVQLQRHVRDVYGVSVSPDQATQALAILSNRKKVGRSYVAPRQRVMDWASRTYGAGQRGVAPASASA